MNNFLGMEEYAAKSKRKKYEQFPRHGSWFSYDKTPRALIMEREQNKVVDELSMMDLMR